MPLGAPRPDTRRPAPRARHLSPAGSHPEADCRSRSGHPLPGQSRVRDPPASTHLRGCRFYRCPSGQPAGSGPGGVVKAEPEPGLGAWPESGAGLARRLAQQQHHLVARGPPRTGWSRGAA